MATFLVEAYQPHGLGQSADLVRSAAEGTAVRYVRSIFVPEDEICFHVFEAPSAEALREVGEKAAVTWQRIVEAVAP